MEIYKNNCSTVPTLRINLSAWSSFKYYSIQILSVSDAHCLYIYIVYTSSKAGVILVERFNFQERNNSRPHSVSFHRCFNFKRNEAYRLQKEGNRFENQLRTEFETVTKLFKQIPFKQYLRDLKKKEEKFSHYKFHQARTNESSRR